MCKHAGEDITEVEVALFPLPANPNPSCISRKSLGIRLRLKCTVARPRYIVMLHAALYVVVTR